MKKPLLSIRQVCERLYLGRAAANQLIKSGNLKAAKIGGAWRIDEDDLESYITLQKHASHAETVTAAVQRAFDADQNLELPEGNPFL